MKIILFSLFLAFFAFGNFGPLYSQSTTTISKSCGECGGRVSESASLGDKCPHCKVIWNTTETSTSSSLYFPSMPRSYTVPIEHSRGYEYSTYGIRPSSVSSRITDENRIFINKIRDFVNAERRRDFDEIKSYFSVNIKRYWNLHYPSEQELRNAYRYSWKITERSENYIVDIVKINDYTYELHTVFMFTTRTGEQKSKRSKVKFVFDRYGKILETYGL